MARRINDVPKFVRKQKVVVVTELPGVPVGTVGVVYYEAGITWFRYHVAFENGIERSNVDGNALVTLAEWKQQEAERIRAEHLAAREAKAAELSTLAVTRGPAGH